MSEDEVKAKGATAKGKRQVGLKSTVAYWPTPATADADRASDHLRRGACSTPRARDGKGRGNDCLPLDAQLWSTPKASDGAKGGPRQRHSDGSPTLPSAATAACPSSPRGPATATPGGPSSPPTRVLNPLFVELLMGWPTGWTGFTPLGTAWSRWLRQSRSALAGLA